MLRGRKGSGELLLVPCRSAGSFLSCLQDVVFNNFLSSHIIALGSQLLSLWCASHCFKGSPWANPRDSLWVRDHCESHLTFEKVGSNEWTLFYHYEMVGKQSIWRHFYNSFTLCLWRCKCHFFLFFSKRMSPWWWLFHSVKKPKFPFWKDKVGEFALIHGDEWHANGTATIRYRFLLIKLPDKSVCHDIPYSDFSKCPTDVLFLV